MSVPDGLPTLSAGAHDAGHGEACVMEYVSLLAGEDWSDRPDCTHPILAHEARTVNDLLRDGDRGRLVPSIGRLFGTAADSPDIRASLRIAQARRAATILEPGEKPRVLAVLERAASWLGRESPDEEVDAAREAAFAFGIEDGGLDAAHRAFHEQASRLFWFAHSSDLGAAEAWATTGLVIAHRIAASGACLADCGNEPARARRMVTDLSALIDAYDEATGRAPREPDAAQLRELTRSLG